MTLPTVEQLEAMLAAATKGPWWSYTDGFAGNSVKAECGDEEVVLLRVQHHGDVPYVSEKGNAALAALAPTLTTQRITDAARIAMLEGFIRDFAATPFNTLPRPFIADPQDRPDDATDLAAVLAWQDDALDLLKGGA